MAKVIIAASLTKEVIRTFKHEAEDVFRAMKELEEHPQKGKTVGSIGGVMIKEIKYKTHRFYCIGTAHQWKFGSTDELAAMIIKFIAMSKKNDQQRKIDEIKDLLRAWGFRSLD